MKLKKIHRSQRKRPSEYDLKWDNWKYGGNEAQKSKTKWC